ncbi:sulfite exporter TauE/SafE family protein [Microbacterium amylolyticum]|uniref:Probable membrane transporter protein n=1 Tax=Microbacterium amylolyticum TaxID=936337 RepID=A0ABS4ZJ28_9MICO|nr:sulfite exporter TauE/SafE family protein [Microbacterium amylolyticum]MBP2437043.1 putative membrane protein YfcA [Microbacterium amylolyticum]
MPIIIVALLAGFVAQMVNGSLGMGYGTITATVLLGMGIAPALVSASVNIATVASDIVSGIAHHRFGNVHWPTAIALGISGAVGGFVGAWALVSLSGLDAARPFTSSVLVALGVLIVWRFVRRGGRLRQSAGPRRFIIAPTGLTAGFLNAVGGGGWGPVTMPVMLTTSKLPAYQVVGSVSVGEIFAAGAAVLGFWWALPNGLTVAWPLVIGLAVGGMIAAPFAAWLTRRIPTERLGATIGFLVIGLNLRTFSNSVGVPTWLTVTLYITVAAAWITSIVWDVRRSRSPQPVAVG